MVSGAAGDEWACHRRHTWWGAAGHDLGFGFGLDWTTRFNLDWIGLDGKVLSHTGFPYLGKGTTDWMYHPYLLRERYDGLDVSPRREGYDGITPIYIHMNAFLHGFGEGDASQSLV